jgi:hypothetical protein
MSVVAALDRLDPRFSILSRPDSTIKPFNEQPAGSLGIRLASDKGRKAEATQ